MSEDYEKLLSMWRDEKQRRQFAENELSLIKGIGNNSPEIRELKKEIDRLTEQSNNFEIISKSHKELNGKLRKELDEVKEDNRKLSKQIEDLDKVKELRKRGLI
tara:strand:+ start:5500 stop:5811 length:312 start_codon:yes stop_codon:yes gene_type:complete